MHTAETCRELFRHFDWASARVHEAAKSLADEQWDRSYEMGKSTLRQTLSHIRDAEKGWVGRIIGQEVGDAIPARKGLVESLTDEHAGEMIRFIDFKGNPRAYQVCDILLHICNHAIHHHAQALNILRHSGIAKPPRLDYLFMYYENPDLPPPLLSRDMLRDYFAYTDWGRQHMMNMTAQLDEAALDRAFEMGMGSIRKNMVHTLAAEEFWLKNWLDEKYHQFLKADEPMSLQLLGQRCEQTAQKRNEYLEHTAEADLTRLVEARTPDGRLLRFPLGVTMMQLCNHGTHHRAQTINMLRQCGTEAPPTDHTIWKRESAG